MTKLKEKKLKKDDTLRKQRRKYRKTKIVKLIKQADPELDALQAIVNNIEAMDDGAKTRTLGFLKSKYAGYWPADF